MNGLSIVRRVTVWAVGGWLLCGLTIVSAGDVFSVPAVGHGRLPVPSQFQKATKQATPGETQAHTPQPLPSVHKGRRQHGTQMKRSDASEPPARLAEAKEQQILPPPGTLGRTYLQPSRPVPWNKHPRTAMLEVTVRESTKKFLKEKYPDAQLKVRVSDMRSWFEPLKGYLGTDGLWHFESKPLYPGLPHIYDVTFEMVRIEHKSEMKYGQRVEQDIEIKVAELGSLRIRLIPGRVVTLEF